MEFTTWLSYVSIITALIAIPGPSSMLITLHGAKYGFKKANLTVLGNLAGSLVLMGLSALGLGAILTSSELLFSIAKYLGASYLIYLGIKTILSTPKNKTNNDEIIQIESNSDLIKTGFLTGASNPKDLIFFAALFPAFLNKDSSIVTQLVILMITWLIVDYSLKVMYVFAGKKITHLFSNANFSTWFNRITGGVFIGFGAVLAGYNKT